MGGLHRGAAVVRAEELIAAIEVVHLQRVVHRVRRPAEKRHPLFEVLAPFDLGQHAVLAGLHQYSVSSNLSQWL
jgi:hypothetical protein